MGGGVGVAVPTIVEAAIMVVDVAECVESVWGTGHSKIGTRRGPAHTLSSQTQTRSDCDGRVVGCRAAEIHAVVFLVKSGRQLLQKNSPSLAVSPSHLNHSVYHSIYSRTLLNQVVKLV